MESLHIPYRSIILSVRTPIMAGGDPYAAELLETDNAGDAKSSQITVGGNDPAAAV